MACARLWLLDAKPTRLLLGTQACLGASTAQVAPGSASSSWTSTACSIPTAMEVEPQRWEAVGIGLFGWLPALVNALQPHPDVSVVVYAPWRLTQTMTSCACCSVVWGRGPHRVC